MLINIIENLGFILAFILIAYALYVMGKYQVLDKHVRLSKLFPQLTNIEDTIEEEKEYDRLRRLLASALD